MHADSLPLVDLFKTGMIFGKDLVIFDDNCYYRGLIIPSTPEPGIIKFILAETRSVRFDSCGREVEDPFTLLYFSVVQRTTYTVKDDGVIAFELSEGGDGYILSPKSPIPLFA